MSQTQYDPEQSEATAELIAQYHEVTAGDVHRASEVLTDDVVLHEADQGEHRRGIDAVVEGFVKGLDAFPDFSVEIHDTVAQADMGASRWTVTGTFEAELDGVEPTGERIEQTGISMFRLEDGKIAEIWDRYDTALARQHLGLGEMD